MEDNSENIVDPEPYIPTAFLNMDMTKNTEENFTDMDIITDDDLIVNMKNDEDGRMRLDMICGDCTLPRKFHPDPGSKCTLAGRMARLDDKEKALIQLELTKRENDIRRKEATRGKRSDERFTDAFVDLTRILAKGNENMENKIGQIADIIQEIPRVGRSQIVARRVCPTWTAGASIEVYSRWVQKWNDEDTSNDAVKYAELVKHLSENKAIPGLNEYMKNIVIPSLTASGNEDVLSILEKLEEKYKKNKHEMFIEFLEFIENFSIKEEDDSQAIWERLQIMKQKTSLLKLEKT